MIPLVSPSIEEYAKAHTSRVPPLLEELEKETYEKTENPEMLCGRVEGMLLQLLIRISGAGKAVEVGTFTGYSALLMAEGLPEDGELITCEISDEHAEMARRYFGRSPHGKKISLRLGHALDTLREIGGESIDFLFIDADKELYPDYYREGVRILRQGGLIAVDNALWSGSVLSPGDQETRAIASFNDMVREDDRVQKVMLTVRDGIYLIRKND